MFFKCLKKIYDVDYFVWTCVSVIGCSTYCCCCCGCCSCCCCCGCCTDWSSGCCCCWSSSRCASRCCKMGPHVGSKPMCWPLWQMYGRLCSPPSWVQTPPWRWIWEQKKNVKYLKRNKTDFFLFTQAVTSHNSKC